MEDYYISYFLPFSACLDGKHLPCEVTLRLSEIKDLKIISQDFADVEENEEKLLQFEVEAPKVCYGLQVKCHGEGFLHKLYEVELFKVLLKFHIKNPI